MRWLTDTLDKLKEASAVEPIECPRGWGRVSFTLDPVVIFPYVDLSRKCPIGGAASCTSCKYPRNPEDTERLRENLGKLDALRQEKVLSESEYAVRRQMIIGSQDDMGSLPGQGSRVAAWILGPLGVVVTGVGCWLATTVHRGCWALAIGGALMLALCISFAVLASTKQRTRDDSFSTGLRKLEPR